MSNTVVNNNFINLTDNKKYVVKVEDPVSGAIYFYEEVTIPTPGVYKLVLRKSANLPLRGRTETLTNAVGNYTPQLQTNPPTYRNRSLTIGNNAVGNYTLPLPLNPPKYRSRSPTIGNNAVGNFNLNKTRGGRKNRKTRRQNK